MAYMCKAGIKDECDACGYCEEELLKSLPVCDNCEEHITNQETAVHYDGKWICDSCLDDLREDISDYREAFENHM